MTQEQKFSLIFQNLNTAKSMSTSLYDSIRAISIQDKLLGYAESIANILRAEQHADGSWGSDYFLLEDRLINTLSAIKFINFYGDNNFFLQLKKARHFCEKNVDKLKLHVRRPVAAEAILPKLWKEADMTGSLPVPLRVLGDHYQKKLELYRSKQIFSRPTTLIHALEVFDLSGHIDDLRFVLQKSGSIGCSPAAAIKFYEASKEITTLKYLQQSWIQFDGAFPVNYPIEIFEINWVLYFLSLTDEQIVTKHRNLVDYLKMFWDEEKGIAWSKEFPVPDLDDTAIAYVHLVKSGLHPDVKVFRSFLFGENIMCFPNETHKAVTHIAHLVEALNISEQKDAALKQIALKDILDQQIAPGVWLDKWHVSPFYATSQVLLSCLNDLPIMLLQQSLTWLIHTQRLDGGWGEVNSTPEESAYAVLAIHKLKQKFEDASVERCLESAKRFFYTAGDTYQAMWIDKNLYCPANIVRAAHMAAIKALNL